VTVDGIRGKLTSNMICVYLYSPAVQIIENRVRNVPLLSFPRKRESRKTRDNLARAYWAAALRALRFSGFMVYKKCHERFAALSSLFTPCVSRRYLRRHPVSCMFRAPSAEAIPARGCSHDRALQAAQ